MTQIEITDVHRETALAIHDQIEVSKSTDVMSIDETAEQVALLCEEHSLNRIVAKRSLVNRIHDELPNSDVTHPDKEGDGTSDQSTFESSLSPEAQELASRVAEGDYERTDCSTCGGNGGIETTVNHAPVINWCEDCNNVLRAAIPSNPPANPDAKINQMEQRLAERKGKAAEMEEISANLNVAQERINSIIESVHVNDETRTILAHIRDTLTQTVRDEIQPRRKYSQVQRPVNEIITELEGYKTALEHAVGNTDE
jgi:predicted Rdx family selenoprotein